jgi:transposase, IS5 family
MRALIDFAIREEYSRVNALGDDLSEINSLIKWDRFRFLEPLIYKNKTSLGGRPNIDIVIIDIVIMVKALVLLSWFGLSDPELERQVTDIISFLIFDEKGFAVKKGTIQDATFITVARSFIISTSTENTAASSGSSSA